MSSSHLRHFIRTILFATFSSAIWYLALHFWQLNRTQAQQFGFGLDMVTMAPRDSTEFNGWLDITIRRQAFV